MRSLAMLAGIVWLAPLAAGAQTAASGPRPADQALADAVFVDRAPRIAPGGGFTTAYAPAPNVSVVRGWPSAMVLGGGPVGVSVTPHAGFGFGAAGGSSAEAGATVKLSSMQAAIQDRLEALGVKDGRSVYGGQGRWYLFAAVRGQAVGFNVQGSGGRSGWSTDPSSALVGDGQVGVGWRKGGVEASFGYVRRGVRFQNVPVGMSDSYADDMAAFAFSWRPHP